jgi:hypothetical protein
MALFTKIADNDVLPFRVRFKKLPQHLAGKAPLPCRLNSLIKTPSPGFPSTVSEKARKTAIFHEFEQIGTRPGRAFRANRGIGEVIASGIDARMNSLVFQNVNAASRSKPGSIGVPASNR